MKREELLAKAQKAFALAGEHPKTPEERTAYAKGRELLSKLACMESETKTAPIYLHNPKQASSRPFWPFADRIKTIPWREFYRKQQNNMIVYRIIPHMNVANNNKRLWMNLYKMLELYERPFSRLERNGFKFTYREKDTLWYDVIFKQEKGEKRVEFYISTSETQALRLKRKLENKMNVTIQEASMEDIQVPKEQTIIQEIKYLKHDLFSLNTNTNDATTPISGLMNTVDELQEDGDFARLSFCLEAENRQKWVKNASWAYEKMQHGKVPQRSNISGKKVIGAAKTLIGGLVNEINDMLVDTFQAFSNTFFKSDKQMTKEKIIKKPFSLEDEINGKRITGSSAEKLNLPVMKTRVRLAVHAQDKMTRDAISQTITGALGDIAENNELQAFKVRIGSRRYDIIQELNTLRLSVRTQSNGDVNLFSTDELAKLALQLPTAELQRKYDDALSVNRRVETDVPSALKDASGIYLGVSEVKEQETPVYMPVNTPDEFYRAYVFIGGQGAGKDTTIKNWIVDGCLNHGIAAIIPEVIVEEGERGMADGIRDALPPDKVIDIDYGDPDYIVPLDLTEVLAKLGRDGASRFADEIVDFLDMGTLTRSKHVLKVIAKASKGSLKNLRRLITDEDYRETIANQLIDEGNLRLATDLVELGDHNEIQTKADPILSRLGDFFDNDKLHDVFAQEPKPEVNFSKWMQEGKVVIVRIPARKLGQAAARTLVHWLTLKIVMTRMLMNKKEQKNGCFIVFNEPEQYATEGLTALMGRIGTEFRKEMMGSLYAFHHWNKLPQSLQENLQGGGVQQFLFMNDHADTFEKSKRRLLPTITVDDACRLPRHYAIISIRAGGEMQNAFICHMARPVSERFPQYENAFLTKRHAQVYGRHWRVLQQAV